MRSNLRWLLFLTAGFWALSAQAAHAYIDPGSGSYVFQIVIAAALGAAVTVKAYWRRIKDFVKGRLGSQGD